MQKLNSPDYLDKYCPSIDGVRALAVIAVICCHFSEKLLPSGYLGVDVFFVISGFVITASLFRHLDDKPLKRFGTFYQRRIKRLLPALVLLIFVATLAICFFSRDSMVYVKTGVFALFGFANFFLYKKSVDYWGMDAELNPFTHTWSLGVEEQFYFLYPLIVIAFTRKQVTSKSLCLLIILMGILSVLSFVGFVGFRPEHFSATYFLMPFRFWEMGLGCLAYLLLKLADGKGRSLFVGTPSILTLVILSALFFTPMEWGLYAPVAAPMLTVFLIIQLVSRGTEYSGKNLGEKILGSLPFQYLGKISYSLYLWHWVILVIARWTIGITAQTGLLLVALMFFFSIFSYHLIENPLRNRKWFGTLGFSALVAAPVLLILSFNILLKVNVIDSKNLYLGSLTTASERLSSEFEGRDFEARCQKIRLLGNSHALRMEPVFSMIGNAHDIDVLVKKGPDYISIPSGKKESLHHLEGVVSPLSEGDLLVISNRSYTLYEKPYISGDGSEKVDILTEKAKSGWGAEMWFDELEEVMKRTRERGVNVVLILPPPEFSEAISHPELHEKQWFRPFYKSKVPSVSEAQLARLFPSDFYERLRIFEKRFDHFYIFDPKPFLRDPSGRYYSVVGGSAAYMDTHHLSHYGSLRLLEPLYLFLIENSLL